MIIGKKRNKLTELVNNVGDIRTSVS